MMTILEMTKFLKYFVDQLECQQIQVLQLEQFLDLEKTLSNKAQNGVDWVIESCENENSCIMATSFKVSEYPGKHIFLCYDENIPNSAAV